MKKTAILCCVFLLAAILGGCHTDVSANPENANTEAMTVPTEAILTTELTTAEAESTTAHIPQPLSDGDDVTYNAVLQGDSFFTDAVFVGDSVTMGLKNYVSDMRNNGYECLSNAQFLTGGSMGYVNSMLDLDDEWAIHPTYNGEEVMIADGVSYTGATKVFILLGMNDFNAYEFDEGIGNASDLVDSILEKNPGVSIYIQSVTPIVDGLEGPNFNNANIDLFNERLREMCDEKGLTFVNVASALKDENNCLVYDYCSDLDAEGVHLTFDGCEKWVEYLDARF